MTVTAAEARIEYAGNGATTVFAYPHQFYQNSDIEVWLFDNTSGVGTLQIVGHDYTVTGAMNVTGGNITMTVAPPAGTTLIIINDPDIVQQTHYVNADDFPADSHEAALDRLTKICQRLSDRVDRAVRAPDYSPEDQVPDADTLVNLVEDATQAAQESAASAGESASSAGDAAAHAAAAASSATDAANSAATVAGDVAAAQASADAAAASADSAAESALEAQVNEINWRGNWSASATYDAHDAVAYAGSSYISKNTNINMQPDTHPANWDVLAQKGSPGAPGSGTGDMLRANNLSDVVSTTAARTNLGLGGAATLNVGMAASTVAAGDDPRIVGAAPLASVVAKAGDTMSGALTVTPKGSLFGGPSGTPATGAVVPADANIKLYDLSGGNWAGFGVDNSGVLWCRTGLSGTPAPAFWVGTDQTVNLIKDPTAPLGVATKQYVDAKAPAAATAAEYIANSAPGKMLTPGAAWGAAANIQPITPGATLTADLSLGFDHYITLSQAGHTFADPTNIKTGQKGVILINQDGTGGRTITTWGGKWKFSGGAKPTLSTAPGAADLISYTVLNANSIFCTFSAGFA